MTETLSNTSHLSDLKQSNSLLKEVLGSLHKLNGIKQVEPKRRDEISKSVLALCDLL